MSANIIQVPYPVVTAVGGPGGISSDLWYDASQETGFSDNEEMDDVTDFSGNGRHGVGVIGNVLKPKWMATGGPNSQPAFRMSDISTTEGGHLTLPDFLAPFSEGHAFAVVLLDIEPSINARAGPVFGDWGNNLGGEYYGFPADSGNYDGFGSTTLKTTGVQATARTNWLVYENRTASGAWSRHINGATSGDDFFSTATNTVAFGATPKIGRRTVGGVRSLYGLIAEVLFYSRVLDTGEATAIYGYLEDKYAITLP